MEILATQNMDRLCRSEEIIDTSTVEVNWDVNTDKWDSLEISLNPAALGEKSNGSGDVSYNDGIGKYTQNTSFVPVNFEECWDELKSRDLTEQKELIKRQIEPNQRSCLTRGWCRKIRLLCSASLDDNLEQERLTILALTKVPYSDSDPLHWRMLTTVYKSCSLSPAAAPKRYGSHWEYIGFQGTDPATDLRGVGVVGLLQLVSFTGQTRFREEVKALMDLSQDTVQNFPFAIVGINVTKSVLMSLKRGRLDRLCKQRESVVAVINDLYRGAFCTFYNTWLCGRKTIADSGFVLKKIEKTLTEKPRKLLHAKMKLKKEKPENEGKEAAVVFHSI